MQIPIKLPNGELSIKLDGITIRGKSIGGRETSIIVEELATAFDMGFQPYKLESIRNVFITHGHTDHIGSLHFCSVDRKLQNINNTWQVVMPESCIQPFKCITTLISSLGRGGYPIGFIDIKSDDDTIIKTIKPFEKLFIDNLIDSEHCKYVSLIGKTNMFVSAYEMKHKIKSFGYIIFEKRKKLKHEFVSLSGEQIKNIRLSGIEVQESIDFPLVAFTGDTIFSSILNNDAFLNSYILIMECTHFLDSPIEDAHNHGHTHFQEFVNNIDNFKNKWIILCHLSQRYRSRDDIEPFLKALSVEQKQRIIVWI